MKFNEKKVEKINPTKINPNRFFLARIIQNDSCININT
jgi:hypothetical protein